MLSKSRLFSFLLLGVGVALLVAGLIVPSFMHGDGRMPLDLKQTTFTLVDDAAHSRLPGDPEGRVVESPVTRQLHMDIQNPSSEKEVTLRVGSSLLRESEQSDLDRLISAEVWNFRLDRLTGETVTPLVLTDQLASPVSEVAIDGIWMKFPAQAEQTSYEVFDPTLRQTRPADFVEELEMDGRTVYRYRQEIEPTNVAQLYAAMLNTTTFTDLPEGEDTRGFLFHSVTRDYFVDHSSGLVVEIREDIDDYFGTADGEKQEQVLLFEGRMSQEQVDAHLAEASDVRDQSSSDLLRWVLIGSGGVLTVLALVGIAGGRRSGQRDGAR